MKYSVSYGPGKDDHRFEASSQEQMEEIIKGHFLTKRWGFFQETLRPITKPRMVDIATPHFSFKRRGLKYGRFQLHVEVKVDIIAGLVANEGCEFVVKLCYNAIPQGDSTVYP